MNDLQKLINDFIRKTMKDIQIEAADEFDRNFEREAFFNKAWARRKFNDDTSRGLLVQTGALRQSITSRLEDHSIVFETTLPYASIHNEGGTITVTRKMKKYFWWKYQTIVGTKANGFSGQLQRKKNGEYRNNKRNRELTEEAKFFKAMALKKVGSKIVIPKRQFIGHHPDLEKLLKEIAEKNTQLIFNN